MSYTDDEKALIRANTPAIISADDHALSHPENPFAVMVLLAVITNAHKRPLKPLETSPAPSPELDL